MQEGIQASVGTRPCGIIPEAARGAETDSDDAGGLGAAGVGVVLAGVEELVLVVDHAVVEIILERLGVCVGRGEKGVAGEMSVAV